MSFRNTGILLIVLIVLGGVVFWVNWQGGAPADTDATPTPAPLTSLSTSDVTSIRIEQEDQSITIERHDDGWVIAGGSLEPAGEDKVTRALDRLTSLKPTKTLDDVQNIADFGLDEPAWTITLTPKGGDAIVYRVGDENPRGTTRYLQVAGDPAIHLVPKLNVENVQQWLEEPPYPPTPTPEPTETSTPPLENHLPGFLNQLPLLVVGIGGQGAGDAADFLTWADPIAGPAGIGYLQRLDRHTTAVQIEVEIQLIAEPPDVEKAQLVIEVAA